MAEGVFGKRKLKVENEKLKFEIGSILSAKILTNNDFYIIIFI